MASHTLLFQPQFHASVCAGTKLQTIRPPRQRPIQPGDTLSLRAWTGLPYGSRQRELARGVCVAADPIEIGPDFRDDEEARRDGFRDALAMRDWFDVAHGLPFRGIRITWTLLGAE